MAGKAYMVAFIHDEKGSNAIAENFGFDKERDADLGTALIGKMMESVREAVRQNKSAPTPSAVVMDFFADLEPGEQGAFMATAMVAYYADRLVQHFAREQAAAALRKFLEGQGGTSGPG
jgi:hypothetical protein